MNTASQIGKESKKYETYEEPFRHFTFSLFCNFSETIAVKDNSASENTLYLEKHTPWIRKWSAETSELNHLVITLRDDQGEILESTGCRIGFLNSEIKNGLLMVNGKPIKL